MDNRTTPFNPPSRRCDAVLKASRRSCNAPARFYDATAELNLCGLHANLSTGKVREGTGRAWYEDRPETAVSVAVEVDVEPGRVEMPAPVLRAVDGVVTLPIAALDQATADWLRIEVDRFHDRYEAERLKILTALDIRDAQYWMDSLFPESEAA